MKVDPYAGSRPARPVFRKEFEDEEWPGETITLFLRKKNTVDEGKIADLMVRMIETYVTGNEATGEKAKPFFVVAGEQPEMSEGLCQMVAYVTVMQHPEEAGDRYTADEMMALAIKYGNAWRRILSACREINGVVEEKKGGTTSASLGSLQNGSTPTRNTLSGRTGSSPASSDDSVSSSDTPDLTPAPM